MLTEVTAQAFRAENGRTVSDGDGIIDQFIVAIGGAPTAERVVVLQSKAERIDTGMTVDTSGVAAMGFESLTDCLAIGRRIVRSDGAGVGGRRRHRRIENAE